MGKYVFIAMAVMGVLFLMNAARQQEQRLQDLKDRGMYPDPERASDDDVRRILEAGHKIEAIKIYRQVHGVGLKEAKEAVEAMQGRSSGA